VELIAVSAVNMSLSIGGMWFEFSPYPLYALFLKSGVCEDGRVLMKTPVLEVEEGLKILKPLLHRCSSSLTLRNDLQDMGVYVMSRWILDFLMVCMVVCMYTAHKVDSQENFNNIVCCEPLIEVTCC
jgi:hypothetical protein